MTTDEEIAAVKALTPNSSTTAYSREQLAKLAFAVFYSSTLCAPENIAAVVREIDCCPDCEHAGRSTCQVSGQGDYCPNDLANDLRQISLALYGPGDPSHYVEAVFGPDTMEALSRPAPLPEEGELRDEVKRLRRENRDLQTRFDLELDAYAKDSDMAALRTRAEAAESRLSSVQKALEQMRGWLETAIEHGAFGSNTWNAMEALDLKVVASEMRKGGDGK